MFKISYQVKTYLEMMQMGRKEWQQCLAIAKTIVENVRQELKLFAETGDKAHKEKADELKRSLPGICFQAADFELSVGTKKFNKGKKGHWREQLKAYLSGLVVIDVDHCGNPRDLFERIKAQFDLKALGILLVYVSASGEGLKIVFKARAEWGNLICNQYEMAALLGILDFVDDACKDSSRLSFVTGEDDVLYLDAEELFDGEEGSFPALEENVRSDYDVLFGDRYRQAPKGDSSPTEQKWADFEAQRKKQRKAAAKGEEPRSAATVEAATKTATAEPSVKASTEPAATDFTDRELAIIKALNDYYGNSLGEGQKHPTFCQQTSHWLCWLADNNPQVAIAMAKELDYVKDWQPQPGEVEDLIQSAASKKLLKRTPKELKELMDKAGINLEPPVVVSKGSDPLSELPFERWCDTIESLFDVFPGLREACEPHPRNTWPFLLFASAMMMGSDMDLCYYYFYADTCERTRLNYIVWGVGDPTGGKRAMERLADLLLAPYIEEGKLADESTNSWKESTDAKGSNKEKDLRPPLYNRFLGARTSNSEFIRSMVNSKEVVDGVEMGRHIVTIDGEKDLTLSKSGSWISREYMVLRSFHNEYDDQHYSNKQSVSARFRVFWNMCETFTPSSLPKLVNERNINSGLDTRTATIPLGPDLFEMMPLRRKDPKIEAYNETLRQIAYKLDQRRGELPLWPLVEHVHQWCDERRAIAKFNDFDRADWLQIKRIPYWGINVSAPYIDLRHEQERLETGTYTIDDQDLALCDLVLDIQYRTQHYWYYELHREYYENQLREAARQCRRTTKFQECFRQLPEEFSINKFTEVFGYANNRSGQKTLERLIADKAIERTMRGNYKKLTSEL